MKDSKWSKQELKGKNIYGKKEKENREENHEIKKSVLQFNKGKSMQSWTPRNLVQPWSSRKKKQIIPLENQNEKLHFFAFHLTMFSKFSL